MAFMRKAAVYLGLVEDDEEAYDEFEDYETVPATGRRERAHEVAEAQYPVEYARPEVPRRSERRAHDAGYSGRPRSAGATALAPAPTGLAEPTRLGWGDPAGPPRVTTLHPRTYNEARAIGEHFREGTPVIMNLTEMDDADAKRLVDFAAGLIFGLRGSIERVTAKVFLLSPQNVEVTAEDKQRLAEGGFFNQS